MSQQSPAARPYRSLLAAGLVLLGLAVAACTPTTRIRQILDNPRDYEGKTVTVEGEVTDVFSVVVVKYFQIDDGSGTIGVVSSKPLPARGQRIKVTGEVREAFSLGDRTLTVLIEQEPAQSRPVSR